jgi:hypothetical protein
MSTECTQERFDFHPLHRRDVVARFDGGEITSDAGALLLREVERRTKILRQLSGCFTDYRDPERIEHSVFELVAQRIYGLALGYEDLNDHDRLRHDPLMGLLAEKADPCGGDRRCAKDRGRAVAGKSTLNRFELTPSDAGSGARYKKIVMNEAAIDDLLVDLFLQAHRNQPPEPIVLDLDATDDPVHGNQEGRFFHGYFGNYCYLPLYLFSGEFLLCARLRPSNIDASSGAKEELERIVGRIRATWPTVPIVIRGDSGFCRDEIMTWCEENGVDYVLGLAKNARLIRAIGGELHRVKAVFEQTGQASRIFSEFSYRTKKSWSASRRVVAKAEHLSKGSNPRFVVTSLPREAMEGKTLYEDVYCARGEMENRIKEQQLALFADRTSTAHLRSNQVRLYLSSFAYGLMQALRRLGLAGTEMARAQCQTIRLKLLKIGAQIKITVRKVWLHLSAGHPSAELFGVVYRNLAARPALRC